MVGRVRLFECISLNVLYITKLFKLLSKANLSPNAERNEMRCITVLLKKGGIFRGFYLFI